MARVGKKVGVNALNWATIISTMSYANLRALTKCVNALQRANIISTLGFWNALFMRVCGMRFPQGFSKREKLAGFCQIFGFLKFSLLYHSSHILSIYFRGTILL